MDGRKQEVEVQTTGIGCAQCQLTNSKGTYQSGCTPQKVTVKRGLIGMGIDAATGAAYDYPDNI